MSLTGTGVPTSVPVANALTASATTPHHRIWVV